MSFARRFILRLLTAAVVFFLIESFSPVNVNDLLVIPLRVNDPRPALAAVVHGSGLGDNGMVRTYAAERLDCAVDAFRTGLVQHIIVSGGTPRAGTIEALAMRRYLLLCGIDSAAIVIEPNSLNTYENALESNRLIEANHWGTPLVITSPFHSRRTRLVWQHIRHTADVPVAIPDHGWVTSSRWIGDRWGGLYILGREYAALAKYWLNGHLGAPRL